MVAVKHLRGSGAALGRGASKLALVENPQLEKTPEVGALGVLQDLFKAFLRIKLRVHGVLEDRDNIKFESAFADALKEFAALSPQALTNPDVVEQMHSLAEDVYGEIGMQDQNEPFDVNKTYSELISKPKGIFWLKSMLQNKILKALIDQQILPTSDYPERNFADIQKFGRAFEEALMSIIEMGQNAFTNPQIVADLNFVGHIMKAEDQAMRDAQRADEARLRAGAVIPHPLQRPTSIPVKAA